VLKVGRSRPGLPPGVRLSWTDAGSLTNQQHDTVLSRLRRIPGGPLACGYGLLPD
jgi:hypothetical protein